MKRIISLLLTVILAVICTSCAKETNSDANSVSAENDSEIISSTTETFPDVSEIQKEEETKASKTESKTKKEEKDIPIPYTTQNIKFTVTVKKSGSLKSIELSGKNAKFIGKVATGTPRAEAFFSGNKDYVLTVNGKEFFYDISTGNLGNTSIKTLSGNVKEQFDSILIGATEG